MDNSGTMHKNDGHNNMVSQSSKGKIEIVDCTRWEEATSTNNILWHAALIGRLMSNLHGHLCACCLQDPGIPVGPLVNAHGRFDSLQFCGTYFPQRSIHRALRFRLEPSITA
jgi:hypothetical protein